MSRFVVVVAAVVLLSAFIASSTATVMEAMGCPEDTACTVHELRIDGCRSVAGNTCKIKRGSTPVISFDYTPDFASSSAHGQVYWVSPAGDLPFIGMETNACQHTTCPLVSGVRQTYSYNFETSRKYQAKKYTIKWKLTNPETEQLCCFQTNINLVK